MTISHLFIIDPQNDFCDFSRLVRKYGQFEPALPVPGADADMLRLANVITNAGGGIDDITLTLDSHQQIDIAHPNFWWLEGTVPDPFTIITLEDVLNKRFTPRDKSLLEYVEYYLRTLESKPNKYPLMLWPVHCEVGTWGHNVHHAVQAACVSWSTATHKNIGKVLKGLDALTENYSAFMPEVKRWDNEIPSSQLGDFDEALCTRLFEADRLYIAGEAGSHCVRASVQDMLNYGTSEDIAKIALITDCMSPVEGCEKQFHTFLEESKEKGVRLITSFDMEDELLEG